MSSSWSARRIVRCTTRRPTSGSTSALVSKTGVRAVSVKALVLTWVDVQPGHGTSQVTPRRRREAPLRCLAERPPPSDLSARRTAEDGHDVPPGRAVAQPRPAGSADVTTPAIGRVDHFHAALDLRGDRVRRVRQPRDGGRLGRGSSSVRRRPGPAARSSPTSFWPEPTRSRSPAWPTTSRGAELHVVYFARDLARQLPALWQESLKNRRTRSYPTVPAARAARGRPPGGGPARARRTPCRRSPAGRSPYRRTGSTS